MFRSISTWRKSRDKTYRPQDSTSLGSVLKSLTCVPCCPLLLITGFYLKYIFHFQQRASATLRLTKWSVAWCWLPMPYSKLPRALFNKVGSLLPLFTSWSSNTWVVREQLVCSLRFFMLEVNAILMTISREAAKDASPTCVVADFALKAMLYVL